MKAKSFKFAGMTIHEAKQQVLFQLYEIYDNREAANIADMLLEKITGWTRIDRVINKSLPLLPPQVEMINDFVSQLLQHRPIQYVLYEAWFCGQRFFVDERVLIPRPETEELCEWILAENASTNLSLLDIGTGSGCIPITIKLRKKDWNITACDISAAALEVAKLNATSHDAAIDFRELDILEEVEAFKHGAFDVIVSNPPYIPEKDRAAMRQNVLRFEPPVALFVKDKNPLLFYDRIASIGKDTLNPGGKIYVELYEDLANETLKLFVEKGYQSVYVKNDFQEKPRMLRAVNI